MKSAEKLFTWIYQVLLVTGEKYEFSGWTEDIYGIHNVLEKNEVHLSNSTLYCMRKPKLYQIKAKTWDQLGPGVQNHIVSLDNVAEWHIKIVRNDSFYEAMMKR